MYYIFSVTLLLPNALVLTRYLIKWKLDHGMLSKNLLMQMMHLLTNHFSVCHSYLWCPDSALLWREWAKLPYPEAFECWLVQLEFRECPRSNSVGCSVSLPFSSPAPPTADESKYVKISVQLAIH